MSAERLISTHQKACTHCGTVKLLGDFSPNPHKRDGRQSWCRDCQREHIYAQRAETKYAYSRAQNKATRRARQRLADAHRDEYETLLDEEMRAEGLR